MPRCDPQFPVDQARRDSFENVIPLLGYDQPVPFEAALKAAGGRKIALYAGENFNDGQYHEIKAPATLTRLRPSRAAATWADREAAAGAPPRPEGPPRAHAGVQAPSRTPLR